MTPELALYYLWALWFASWIAAAFWSNRAATRPSFLDELPYRLVTLAGAFLLFGVVGSQRLWALDNNYNWALCVVCASGFAFCWWARIHLGRLWSGWITKKADHRIVDTGPYGIVRHPIYTGVIVAGFATAIVKGTVAALTGAAILTLGFWVKASLEERFLRNELGPEIYDAYRRRVPMLLPFGPRAA